MNQQQPRGCGKKNRNKIKVLHIAGWYPSQRNPVAGVFVREHVKATALYNNVAVLYSEGVNAGLSRLYEVDENLEDGIRTLRIHYKKSPVPKTTYFIYLLAMFGTFRKLLKDGFRPDIIHAHVYSAGVPAVLLGKRYRIPVVVTEHFSGFPRGLIRGIERFKAKFAFEMAAVVCPVSKDLQKHIEQMGIKARFQVIPNVVDTSLFAPDKLVLRKNKPMRLLTVALLGPKKGIPYLLEAIALLKEKRNDLVLDIVGDGPNRKEYETLTEKLGLKQIVNFHGLKTKQEVAEFFRRCDLFVLPSLFETFGVVLIEALACGKPVIAPNIGGPKEIVKDEVGRLVPPGNPEAIAKAIEYVLDSDYDPEKIAKYAQEHYGRQAVAKSLDQLYRMLSGEPNE